MAPTSPAKRVTRARAAKSATIGLDEPSKTALAAKSAGIRKMKAAGKPEGLAVTPVEKPVKKSTAKATTNTATVTVAPRRRVKVTPLAVAVFEKVESAPTDTPAPEKVARARKNATQTESSSKLDAVLKKKKTSSTLTKDEVKPAPKARGRPKKVVMEVSEPAAESKKPARQTRKKTESELEPTIPTDMTVVKITTLSKKKVTFQELPEDDKENQPVPTKRAAGKKDSASTTGLRARPKRKPAAGATRKRTATGRTEAQAPRALTPKKITQVARSSTPIDSDEDELNGGKTPVRDLSQSPRRDIISIRSSAAIKKLDFAQTLSPTTTMKASVMSPPRRLPQSPFKNSLKQSPKRGEGIPIFPTLTATLGISATGATNPQAEAALQQSPKRGVVDLSIFSQSTAKLQRSPNKLVLSQSPVRRIFSPTKQSVLSTSIHAKSEVTEAAMSSCFRSSRSPVRSAKVHRLSDDELTTERVGSIDFDESVMNIRSPIKLSNPISSVVDGAVESSAISMDADEDAIISPATPRGPWSKAEEAQYAPIEEEMEHEKDEANEQLDFAIMSAEDRLPTTGNVATYLLNSCALRSEDDSSEDELQVDETLQQPSFVGRASLFTKTATARLSSGLATDSGSSVGFTPLATQLSGWLASSPEKQSKSGATGEAGMFSPLAALHVPGEVQISRHGTPVQRQSLEHRQPLGLRKSIVTRSSSVHAPCDSPAASSYFADEMGARDMEVEVEGRASKRDSDVNDDDSAPRYEQTDIELVQNLVDANASLADGNDTVSDAENCLEDILSTTGVLEEPCMTDTAMLDFVNIAHEAEELAPNSNEPPASTASSEYGDENTEIITRQDTLAFPLDSPAQLSPEVEEPGKVVQAEDVQGSKDIVVEYNTPMRPDLGQQRFANTIISKVPLRPEGNISPIRNPKKRSRSLSAGPGSAKKPLLDSGVFSIPQSKILDSLSPGQQACSPAQSLARSTPGQTSFAVSDFGDSTLDDIEIADDSKDEINDSNLSKMPSSLKSSKMRNTVATPVRTPLKAVGAGVLHGAVVYVDVHTTEGADASGIFNDLLTQMGAKCMREWKWNPRASLAVDDVENMATPARIGITHVVYKDGGKRTLEKVRDTKGEVCCVGVAWVLDCERENKWLDESVYTIDTNIVPRGGSRRRKSMEPRALINANGNLSTARGRSISAEMTKEMRDELIHTPVRRLLSPLGNSADILSAEDKDTGGSPESEIEAQAVTPTGFVKYDPSTSLSPKTPYLMQEGARLVQQSAPPKQIQQGLFPISGKIEDQPDENTRNRLEIARRRTMNWRPRVASPLGK